MAVSLQQRSVLAFCLAILLFKTYLDADHYFIFCKYYKAITHGIWFHKKFLDFMHIFSYAKHYIFFLDFFSQMLICKQNVAIKRWLPFTFIWLTSSIIVLVVVHILIGFFLYKLNSFFFSTSNALQSSIVTAKGKNAHSALPSMTEIKRGRPGPRCCARMQNVPICFCALDWRGGYGKVAASLIHYNREAGQLLRRPQKVYSTICSVYLAPRTAFVPPTHTYQGTSISVQNKTRSFVDFRHFKSSGKWG